MRIKNIKSQHRRDFQAVFVCEGCGREESKSGYDDDYFHRRVIPQMVCKGCGEKSPSDYKPRDTKYSAGEVI